MNIHEYQAKKILRDYGVPVSNGVIIFSVNEIEEKIKINKISCQSTNSCRRKRKGRWG